MLNSIEISRVRLSLLRLSGSGKGCLGQLNCGTVHQHNIQSCLDKRITALKHDTIPVRFSMRRYPSGSKDALHLLQLAHETPRKAKGVATARGGEVAAILDNKRVAVRPNFSVTTGTVPPA